MSAPPSDLLQFTNPADNRGSRRTPLPEDDAPVRPGLHYYSGSRKRRRAMYVVPPITRSWPITSATASALSMPF